MLSVLVARLSESLVGSSVVVTSATEQTARSRLLIEVEDDAIIHYFD